MEVDDFDESAFFLSVARSGARAVLIGRREARERGRYVLENGEHVDVLVARAVPTVDGARVSFDDVWARRETIAVAAGVDVAVPSLDDLEATKRFASRPKDAEDIRLLAALRRHRGGP